ncbi:unnamed protein product [Symbiodinium sp. KB8]|nr:unnamed protein product [Symbiodinium sp. KB8]
MDQIENDDAVFEDEPEDEQQDPAANEDQDEAVNANMQHAVASTRRQVARGKPPAHSHVRHIPAQPRLKEQAATASMARKVGSQETGKPKDSSLEESPKLEILQERQAAKRSQEITAEPSASRDVNARLSGTGGEIAIELSKAEELPLPGIRVEEPLPVTFVCFLDPSGLCLRPLLTSFRLH